MLVNENFLLMCTLAAHFCIITWVMCLGVVIFWGGKPYFCVVCEPILYHKLSEGTIFIKFTPINLQNATRRHSTYVVGLLFSSCTVTKVYENQAQNLLAVDHNGFEVLVPLNDQIIKNVDVEKAIIKASLPDGLLDIYLEEPQ